MPPALSSFRSLRLARGVVAVLLAMLVFVMAAAAWKPLHEWLHGDLDHDDDCAIALYVSGSCDSPCVEVAVCPAPVRLVIADLVGPESWVPKLSLSACVFERGPPRLS